MSLRLIEIVAQPGSEERVRELIADDGDHVHWTRQLADGRQEIQVLIEAGRAEAILDRLESWYAHHPDFRMMVTPVEATIPRLEKPEADEAGTKPPTKSHRISREELYADLAEGGGEDPAFLLTVFLSTLVAAIGLLRDDAAVIIGAMVIAPLLGPNMALALATTLGDKQLAARSLKANASGLGLAVLVAAVIGVFAQTMGFSPIEIPAVLARTGVGLTDLILALAAGCAGALAYTRGAAGTLVGVMVAVALLPPVVCTVMLLTAGEFALAGRAALLFVTNVIGVNLSAVSVFLAGGIRPRTWWEADRARRATRRAVTAWLVLLVILIVVFALI